MVEFNALKKQLETKLNYELDEKELKKYLREEYKNGVDADDYRPQMISLSDYARIHSKSRTTIQTYRDYFKSVENSNGRITIDRCELYWTHSLWHIRKDIKGLSASYSESDYKLLNLLSELSEKEKRDSRKIILEAIKNYAHEKYPNVY